MQRTGEQLVVGPVDGVTALECHHVLAFWQSGTYLSGGLARERTLRELHARDGTAEVEPAALTGNHADGRMLQGAGAVAAKSLPRLIRLPLALYGHHGQTTALVGQQQSLTDNNVGAIGVHHDRQTKEQARGGAVALHDGLIVLLVHEAAQRGESPHHQQLDVTGVAVTALDGVIHAGTGRIPLIRGKAQVHERAAVGCDQSLGSGAGHRAGGT